MAEKVDQDDIAFVRSLIDCTDKPTHESMFIPFFAAKIGAYRAEAFAAGRQQGLREAAAIFTKAAEATRQDAADGLWDSIEDQVPDAISMFEGYADNITALIEGEGE
jgi:hypothetical protein